MGKSFHFLLLLIFSLEVERLVKPENLPVQAPLVKLKTVTCPNENLKQKSG